MPPSSPPAAIPEPLHLLRDEDGKLLPAKRRRGRPKKTRPPIDPNRDEHRYIAETNRARRAHIEGDQLVNAIEGGDTGRLVLDQVMVELATEASAIRYELALDCQEGREHLVDRKRGRRIDALSKMGSVLLGSAKLGLIDPSVGAESAQRIYALFVDTVRQVAEETLMTDAEQFMLACEAGLDGWEDRVD